MNSLSSLSATELHNMYWMLVNLYEEWSCVPNVSSRGLQVLHNRMVDVAILLTMEEGI